MTRMNFFLLTALLCLSMPVRAQKAADISDSLWCERLNELIKCASLDEISQSVSGGYKDTSAFFSARPSCSLTGLTKGEVIAKQYGKVTYSGYFYSAKNVDSMMIDRFRACHDQLRSCLAPWEEARLKNGDTLLSVPEDYFFTNSEDETTVRLDIFKDPVTEAYQVRLRIY